jgi:hypothetical protein
MALDNDPYVTAEYEETITVLNVPLLTPSVTPLEAIRLQRHMEADIDQILCPSLAAAIGRERDDLLCCLHLLRGVSRRTSLIDAAITMSVCHMVVGGVLGVNYERVPGRQLPVTGTAFHAICRFLVPPNYHLRAYACFMPVT